MREVGDRGAVQTDRVVRRVPEAKKSRPRHHYLPFGAGPRICIGAHFALLEAQLALATMVQRTRLRMLATRVTPEPLVTLRPRGGMPAVVGITGFLALVVLAAVGLRAVLATARRRRT